MESNSQLIRNLQDYISEHIIGQEKLVSRILIALLADGHLLVEGAPGLAKTTAIKTLAEVLEGDFQRIQFTPDLLPADLTGTEIFRPQDASFVFQHGPLFHNLILADEINRAPAKVQSALLEAMGERQITIGKVTRPLPDLFLVMATQNPIEQQGTYPLPEAQLDRFLMYVCIGYPKDDSEKQILALAREQALKIARKSEGWAKVSQSVIFAAREEILKLHMSPAVEAYLIQLVLASRNPVPYSQELAGWIRYGASPRATIALDRCARAHAWLSGRDFVTTDDVHEIAPDVLRHRVLLGYEAEAAGITPDLVLKELMSLVPAP